MRRLVRRVSEPSVLPPHHRDVDPWHMFTVLGPSMVETARYMRQFARHYDGFNVGGCALMASVVEDTIHDVTLITGANQNLAKGQNPTKVCAEPIILKKGKTAGFNKLIAMVVSGPPQPDTQSGVEFEVISTCGNDRELYSSNEEVRDIVDDDALHVSVHPTEDKFIVQETSELLTAHALPGEATPPIFKDQGFEKWRRAGPLYLREIEYIESQGEEPLRPLVAMLAITGQLDIAA